MPSVEYSNLQFTNTGIICNISCFFVVSVVVVIVDLIYTQFHLILLLCSRATNVCVCVCGWGGGGGGG